VTTIDDLVRDLAASSPELNAVLQKHLAYYDELLPHVLFGDVTRWLVARGPDAAVLAVLERHMGTGDDEVQNVLVGSFLENLIGETGWKAIRRALGPRLRLQLETMERLARSKQTA
jgi:hypothetical protein